MINSAGVFDAQWAGHEVSLAEDYAKVKQYRPNSVL
jgi:hypothetical protein